VESHGRFDERSVDLGRPVAVGDRLESTAMTSGETPVETAATALALLHVGDVLEELRRAPAFLGRERERSSTLSARRRAGARGGVQAT